MQNSILQAKNQNRLKKKSEELKYAQFFISRLNRRLGFDYRAESNEDEENKDEFVDIYARSVSNRQPPLNLQITTKEGVLYNEFAELRNIAKRTGQDIIMGPVINIDIDNEEWIRKAIKDKEKKYAPSIQQNIVLLVCGEFYPMFNEEYAKIIFLNLKENNFKGIYFLKLPDLPENSTRPHNGQIIAIKDIYGSHGESF